ncbi:putative coiled-coil protein SlyX [Nocardioides ginsengisegetis]|uniref:Putative coiled-coil protein SlyX n=1 Tax=Nocardioides ginsengisegetis TaxID=661491 RepID=A0A7W3J468_9ACTN|nr:hypothetical protein [Nocardioides ginsengisegetis]MBA8805997.1 putative coiled-coil protein SlyX [Nocardioides ginsengisegetis]
MTHGLSASAQLLILLGGALAVLAGWLRWVRPKIRNTRRDTVAIRDAILGRDAIVDTITQQELAPALPGIGQRMAHQEAQMQTMTEAVTQLAQTHQQMAEVRAEVKSLAGRVEKLEAGTVERIVTRAESAAAFRAIEAAHNSHPDEVDES